MAYAQRCAAPGIIDPDPDQPGHLFSRSVQAAIQSQLRINQVLDRVQPDAYLTFLAKTDVVHVVAMGSGATLLALTFDDCPTQTIKVVQMAAARRNPVIAATDNALSSFGPFAAHLLYVNAARFGRGTRHYRCCRMQAEQRR